VHLVAIENPFDARRRGPPAIRRMNPEIVDRDIDVMSLT